MRAKGGMLHMHIHSFGMADREEEEDLFGCALVDFRHNNFPVFKFNQWIHLHTQYAVQ